MKNFTKGLLATVVVSAFAFNANAKTELSMSSAYTWSGGVIEGNTVTFSQAWDGLAWWLDGAEGYVKCVVKYAEPVNYYTQLFAQYAGDDNNYTAGNSDAYTIEMDMQNAPLNQLAIQNSEAGTLTIESVTLYTAADFAPAFELGTPVFNVDEEPIYNAFNQDLLLINGINMTFPEAVGVTPDMTVKVNAVLKTTLPGYGVPSEDDVDPGFGMPELVDCTDVTEFTGDAVFGDLSVAFTDFVQYIYEAGNNGIYGIDVKSIEVFDGATSVYSWEQSEEEPVIGTVFSVEFPVPVDLAVNDAEWLGIEDGVIDVEDANINGVVLAFPFATLGTDDATVSVFATLYDVTEMGTVVGGDDEDDNMGVVGPEAVAQQMFVGTMNVETGVYEVALFAEQLAAGHTYVISVETITVEDGEEVIYQWDNVETEFATEPFAVISTALEIEPSFLMGEEEIALNGHSAVSVDYASAIRVNFVNGSQLKNATYAIDKLVVDEEGDVAAEYVASGFLSLSGFGYAEFDKTLAFISGNQYKLTIKAWDVEELFDENWNMAEPVAVEEYLFNGAADAAVAGVAVFGVERGQFEEDMINIGVPVSFPELQLPFYVVPEECEIYVGAILTEVSEEENEDDIDGGFGGVNYQVFDGNTEGGVVNAYLFPEALEVGKTYIISLAGLYFINGEEEFAVECDDEVMFTVVESEGGEVSINVISAENVSAIYNIFGQKANAANGFVIVNGKKVMVK